MCRRIGGSMRKRIISASMAAALLVGATMTGAAASPLSPSDDRDAQLDQAFANYLLTHHGDREAVAEFVESHGGTMSVAASEGRIATHEGSDAAFGSMGTRSEAA